jgi:CheY-like chemotaxis protein
MENYKSQLVNQAVFRIMEKVHGQSDLNTMFTVLQEIINDMLEKCVQKASPRDSVTMEMLSQIDHDLRTPMSGILGFAELLSEELQDPAQKRKADHVLESARRLMKILDGLIGLYAGDSQQVVPHDVTEETEEEAMPFEPEPVVAERKPRKGTVKKLPNVLIVEDNLVNIQLLMIYIRRYCNIFSSRNAKSAIQLCRQQKFDAILMDINLGPGMNGIEAMQEIHKIQGSEEIPIIAVTGYASYGDRARFLNAGFTDYIKKPIEREVIREIMERLFRKEDSYLPSN